MNGGAIRMLAPGEASQRCRAMYAPQGAFFSELFGARVRYSGASLGVQLSSVLAGGLSPLIATWFLQHGYGRGALSLYLIGMAIVTIVSVFVATETMHHDIERHDKEKAADYADARRG